MQWGTLRLPDSGVQARLSAVAPQFFPLHQQPSPVLEEQGLGVIIGQNLLRVHLRPKRDDPLDSSELFPTLLGLRVGNAVSK